MSKKHIFLRFLLCALPLLSCGGGQGEGQRSVSSPFFSSSTQEGQGEYSLSAPAEFAIKLNDVGFDFSKGCHLRHNEAKVRFQVDASGVDFSRVGSYRVTFSSLDRSFAQSVPAKVYAVPAITGSFPGDSLPYAERHSVADYFLCHDSFGAPLKVEASFPDDGMGRIPLDGADVHLTATDAAGNVASRYLHGVRLTDMQEPKIADLELDLSSPDNEIPEAKRYTNPRVAYAGHVLEEGTEWLLGSRIAKRYLKKIGTGRHTFVFSCLEGYSEFHVTVRDQEEPLVVYDTSLDGAFLLENTLSLQEFAVLDEDSYQNISFSYSLTRDGERCDLREKLPIGEYLYTAMAMRGGQEVSRKTIHFHVLPSCDYYTRDLRLLEKSGHLSSRKLSISYQEKGDCLALRPEGDGADFYLGADLIESAKEQGRNYLSFRAYYPTSGAFYWFGTGDWTRMVGVDVAKEEGRDHFYSVDLNAFDQAHDRLNLYFTAAEEIDITEISFLRAPISVEAVTSFVSQNPDGGYSLYSIASEGATQFTFASSFFAEGIEEKKTQVTLRLALRSQGADPVDLLYRVGNDPYASLPWGEDSTASLTLPLSQIASSPLSFRLSRTRAGIDVERPLYS